MLPQFWMDHEHMPQPLPGSGSSFNQSRGDLQPKVRDESHKDIEPLLWSNPRSSITNTRTPPVHIQITTSLALREEKEKKETLFHRHSTAMSLPRASAVKIHPSSRPAISCSSSASFVDPLAHRLVASRGVVAFDMTALGFAVVYEQVDGRGARLDEGPSPELQETEEQYEHNQLDGEFLDCTLFLGGLPLVFGLGEFDVDHVVVVVVVCRGSGGSNRFVAFLADEGAGVFVSGHDVKSIKGRRESDRSEREVGRICLSTPKDMM